MNKSSLINLTSSPGLLLYITRPYVLLFFSDESESLPEGEWQVQVARFLPKLQSLWSWVKRCGQVCQELVAQLVALYSSQYNGKPLVCAAEVHFQVTKFFI